MKLKLFSLSILALLSLVVYQKYSEYSTLKSIDSYESCIAAKGSVIQESYPATCVTRLGIRFSQALKRIPVENTNNWVVYTNEKYEYSFKFIPENLWSQYGVWGTLDDEYLYLVGGYSDDRMSPFLFWINNLGRSTPDLKQWWKDSYLEKNQSFFGGKECFDTAIATEVRDDKGMGTIIFASTAQFLIVTHKTIDQCPGIGDTKMLIINHKENLFLIKFNHSDESQKILSTFKFTN